MRDLLAIVIRCLAAAVSALLIACAAPAFAQELYLLNGITRDRAIGGDDSFAWVLDYSERLSEHFSYSLVYVNEGHLVGHHRDGLGAQLWAKTDLLDRRLSVAVGAGPYLYFDTAARPAPVVYADEHGVSMIYSLATTWHLNPRWGIQLRANYIAIPRSIDTTSFLVGIGYKFDARALPGASAPWSAGGRNVNEVTAYLARTYVNNFEAETAAGQALEYRRNLSRNVEWTLSAINEGNPGPLNRRGVMSEIWATRTVFDDRVTFGVGIGPYLSYDRRDNDRARLSGAVSLTASYRFPEHWVARATWHRVATDYHKDTDVFLIGAGYRW